MRRAFSWLPRVTVMVQIGTLVGTLLALWNIFDALTTLREATEIHIARATCQTMLYAITTAERAQFQAQTPPWTCTLTLPFGNLLLFHWEATMWQHEPGKRQIPPAPFIELDKNL